MTIEANGVTLFYETSGSGTPLIILHGNGEDHHIFSELAGKMAARFRVYAVDSRNHGQSQKTADYSYETMTEDIFHFIRTLNLGAADIVGFSDGAIIGLLLAMRHPDAVRRMALLGVNLKPDDFTEECYQSLKEAYEETKDPLLNLMLREPQIELDDVRNVSVPTLLIAGDDDIFRQETFKNLEDAMPNAELKIMTGHDHSSYIVNRDILYPDLTRFFS